ncbi:MAG: PaaI family thioesterase [Bacillota bacterium]
MDLTKNVQDNDMCFACGQKNPISLGLDFKVSGKNKVQAVFVPQKNFQGYIDIVHGGIISTVLDEAMSKVIIMTGECRAVTGEINVRFKTAAPVNQKYIVTGNLKKSYKKLFFTSAVLEDEEGKIYATAEAKFMNISG